jgi:hypothetical protein
MFGKDKNKSESIDTVLRHNGFVRNQNNNTD